MTDSTTDAHTVRPTKKQRDLLNYIEAFIGEHGYSPSYREIMNGLAYTSVATVALHVNSLISRGHLRKRDHSARSLEVVTAPNAQATDQNSAGPDWLIAAITSRIAAAEAAGVPSSGEYREIAGLLTAVDILGLSTVAKPLAARFAALKSAA